MRTSSMVRNPPWVGQAIAATYEWLQSNVRAQWLPVLASVKVTPEGEIVGEIEEYGCGAYGCVLPTGDPKIVLKLTADDTEAEFAADLANDLAAPICVRYPLVVRMPVTDPSGAPLFFLWRDAADHVGKIGKQLGKLAKRYIDTQHQAGDAAYRALYDGAPEAGRLLTLWLETCEAMARQTEVPEIRPLGEGLVEVWAQQNILFGDIHAGNLGLVEGRWVVTDPGHIAVVDRALVHNPSSDHVADIVNDAARRVAVGPGRAQAYIEEVWQQVKREGKDGGYSYDQFKCELIRLQHDNLIGLERAPDARAKVARASELRIDSGVFHMVKVEGAAPAATVRVSYQPLDDEDFIRTVNQVAGKIGPEGRFGDRKVFISEVWDIVSEDPRFSRMGVDAFKQRLFENRKRIQLARADLVSAMDPDLVDASELKVAGATYHFVVDPRFADPAKPPAAPAPTRAPAAAPAALLAAVHAAIPRIGPEGRYGPSKVFVSEVWKAIEHDPSVRGISFDQFKRWLIAANRDGDVSLARADVVGAMNRKQVEESEIQHMGATFHFVIDPDKADQF